jgi:hypothetical protein
MIAKGARGGLFCRVEASIKFGCALSKPSFAHYRWTIGGFSLCVFAPNHRCGHHRGKLRNTILRNEANKSFIINVRHIERPLPIVSISSVTRAYFDGDADHSRNYWIGADDRSSSSLRYCCHTAAQVWVP